MRSSQRRTGRHVSAPKVLSDTARGGKLYDTVATNCFHERDSVVIIVNGQIHVTMKGVEMPNSKTNKKRRTETRSSTYKCEAFMTKWGL